jgi:hypothetical protein
MPRVNYTLGFEWTGEVCEMIFTVGEESLILWATPAGHEYAFQTGAGPLYSPEPFYTHDALPKELHGRYERLKKLLEDCGPAPVSTRGVVDDVHLVSCFFCGAEKELEAAMEDGWMPSFYDLRGDDTGLTACDTCNEKHLHTSETGEPELNLDEHAAQLKIDNLSGRIEEEVTL